MSLSAAEYRVRTARALKEMRARLDEAIKAFIARDYKKAMTLLGDSEAPIPPDPAIRDQVVWVVVWMRELSRLNSRAKT